MNDIKHILKEKYNISSLNILRQQGGLSAAAYKIIAENSNYFLKIYSKDKSSTSIWTDNIYEYMPILLWLNNNTPLKSKIICPISTLAGSYCCEDDRNLYVLFEYISGATIGRNQMCNLQINELAKIMAYLHSIDENKFEVSGKMREDFSLPFCEVLTDYFAGNFLESPSDVKKILLPFANEILEKINLLKSLANKQEKLNNTYVLCHTDAHGFNLMRGEDHIVLVDFEGMKFAPAEADLFMFAKQDYFDVFLKRYTKIRPGYTPNSLLLEFYSLRRKIEDLSAFLESILLNTCDKAERDRDLNYLKNECVNINQPFFL